MICRSAISLSAIAAISIGLAGGASAVCLEAQARSMVQQAQAQQPATTRTIAGFRRAQVTVYNRSGGFLASVPASDLRDLVGAAVAINRVGHYGLALPGGEFYFSLVDISLSGGTGRTAAQICAEVLRNKAKSGSSGMGLKC